MDVDKDTMKIVIRGAEDNEMDRLVLTKSGKYLRETETLAGSGDTQTRMRAVKDLAALNDNTSGEALKRLAQDKDPGIAAAALRALVQTGQLSTNELLTALRNPALSQDVPKGWGSVSPSQLAQNRLYERPAEEQMAVAKELLGDEDHRTDTSMKRLGIRLLANVASTEAIGRLDKLAKAPSDGIRAETARCLGRIFDPYCDPLGMDMGLPSFLSERLAEFPGRVASRKRCLPCSSDFWTTRTPTSETSR